MRTAIEWIIEQIETEEKVLSNLYGSEIKGRLIALAYIKRTAIKAKEVEEIQIINAWDDGNYNYFCSKKTNKDFNNGKEYYTEKYNK